MNSIGNSPTCYIWFHTSILFYFRSQTMWHTATSETGKYAMYIQYAAHFLVPWSSVLDL